MELYIGGFSQGKLNFVKSLYPNYKVFCEDDFEKILSLKDEKFIWNNFHLTIKNLLKAKIESSKIQNDLSKIILSNPEIIIISCEIGSGIIPLEKDERFFREFTGRLLCQIAKNSKKVVRIICGLSQQLK